jgi:hypothetical protein
MLSCAIGFVPYQPQPDIGTFDVAFQEKLKEKTVAPCGRHRVKGWVMVTAAA